MQNVIISHQWLLISSVDLFRNRLISSSYSSAFSMDFVGYLYIV
jgi:hypothetical protein